MADAMMDEFMKFQAEMDAIGAKDAEASENAPTDAPTDAPVTRGVGGLATRSKQLLVMLLSAIAIDTRGFGPKLLGEKYVAGGVAPPAARSPGVALDIAVGTLPRLVALSLDVFSIAPLDSAAN